MKYTSKDHTFVVCAYKESKYLEFCIQSLKKQTIVSNIILCTSTPNLFIRNIADEYNLKLYVREGQSGLSQDWNFAASCVETKLYTLCHQDDYYFEKYAETIIQYANRCETPIIFYTGYAEDKKGILEKKNLNLMIKEILNYPMKFAKIQNWIWARRRILSLGNPICCPSVSFCKEMIGEELFDPAFKNAADWDMWERLSKKSGGFVYIPKILMAHRIHEESTTSANIADNTRRKEDFVIFRRFWPTCLAKVISKVFSISEKNNS